jgi:hypothetical protein
MGIHNRTQYWLSASLLFVCVFCAHAQLGKSESECDTHFGQPTGRGYFDLIPPADAQRTYPTNSAGLLVNIQFYHGKAAQILYTKDSTNRWFSLSECAPLLAENGGSSAWVRRPLQKVRNPNPFWTNSSWFSTNSIIAEDERGYIIGGGDIASSYYKVTNAWEHKNGRALARLEGDECLIISTTEFDTAAAAEEARLMALFEQRMKELKSR